MYLQKNQYGTKINSLKLMLSCQRLITFRSLKIDCHPPELPSDSGNSACISDNMRNPSESKPAKESNDCAPDYLYSKVGETLLTFGWALQGRRARPNVAKWHTEQTTFVCGRSQMQLGSKRAASVRRLARAELDGLATGRARGTLFIAVLVVGIAGTKEPHHQS